MRRQSTELTEEEGGKADGAGRRELSVQSGDSSESDEDADPPRNPLRSSLTQLSGLERLGLHRVALTEQDVEAAFAHLALAFRCDAFTLQRRVQVEERARSVAEENIQRELEECRAALQRLGLSCVDPKRKELVWQLQHSLAVLAGAIERATCAAEKLGAVHQEARMSRAAEVMVQHVENLKRHHLREHTELEEMKRLIQQNSRNRQVAENRDDDEQRLKLPLLRTFQQVSARRRVSIAVIPKQLTPFPSPEGEAAKAAGESGPGTERHGGCPLEDSTAGYFILRADSSSLLRSPPGADSTESEGDRGCRAEGGEPELRRRGSTREAMKEEPDGASDSGGPTEELQLTLTSKAAAEALPRPWAFLPQRYWLLLWLLFLGITCLALMWILELQKQQPPASPKW